MAASRAKFNKQLVFKVIVVGDSNVGKTCLTHRFCSEKFPEKIRPTIAADFHEKNFNVGGETIKFWDTAGQERYNSIGKQYYRNAHAVVFVYDATKWSSFNHLSSWIEECSSNYLGPDILRFLVGNKCDCGNKIEVATNVAQKFADFHQMPLYETSAKDNRSGYEVEAIPFAIARKLQSCAPMMTPASITPFSSSSPSSSNISLTANKNVHIQLSPSKWSCC